MNLFEKLDGQYKRRPWLLIGLLGASVIGVLTPFAAPQPTPKILFATAFIALVAGIFFAGALMYRIRHRK